LSLQDRISGRDGLGVQAQESRDVARAARLGEQESLVQVAAKLACPLALLAVLDPLRHNAQSETVSELCDSGDDPFVLGVGPKAHYEGAVDLEVADGQALQVAE